MSVRVEMPNEGALRVAERVYDALVAEAALLREPVPETAAVRIPLRRLYTYVTDPPGSDADLQDRLDEDPAVRADLRRLTQKIAAFHVPRLAAAAVGPVSQRTAPGCHIRLEPSRAEAAQTYIVISLDDLGRQPRWLAVFFEDDRCRRIALPEPRDGVIQLLIETESELVGALRDPESEIFIDG